MKLSKKEEIIQKIFRIGSFLKLISATLQIMFGFFLIIASHDKISHLIIRLAQTELIEDSKDYIASYLLQLGTSFSLSIKLTIAIYLIAFGTLNFLLLYGLWKNKRDAFPIAAAVFSIFLAYQMYKYLFRHSIIWILLSLIDAVYIALIIHEYNVLGVKNSKIS